MQAQPASPPPPLPAAYSADECARGIEALRHILSKGEDATHLEFLLDWIETPQGQALLAAVCGNSPYLTRLLLKNPKVLLDFVLLGADDARDRIFFDMREKMSAFETSKEVMPYLRRKKAEVALLAALADIGGRWPLSTTTETLSDFAELSIRTALACLLRQALAKGEVSRALVAESGVFVLGMGKLGSMELNYSSDIDLIILYDPARLPYCGKHTPQHFMTKLAQDMVSILQERTGDGYVFRTDLRLRPDPRSTPPAVTIGTAIAYYESVGQNWERAAMIKARIVGGDEVAGRAFLEAIRPFIWRKHLDFAAIDDILSIKRQMHSKMKEEIVLAGHNIKTGRGGIREIEFLAQIHQLIWGGKMLPLRIRGTLRTLAALEKAQLLRHTTRSVLEEAYVFLRTVEHRLQMIEDQQTQTLPETPEEMRRLSLFLGFADEEAFSTQIYSTLRMVHRYYNAAFKNSSPLGEDEGRLVFTGVESDAETLKTLTQMGYKDTEKVSAVIRDWHKGYRRATRTKRSRELLTELMPHLLKALSKTASPDGAFHRFDEFMERLPAGVQIFSLFSMNPHLLTLVADIMGSAPQLGETLSHSPHLLYSVLTTDFFGTLPTRLALETELSALLIQARDTQESLAMLHTFKSEKQFQAGVQLLRRAITPQEAGVFLSMLTDLVIASVTTMTCREFTQLHGVIPQGHLGILAIGKLGGQDLMFGSDCDLMFLYEATSDAVESVGGEKPLGAMVYYGRLTQRVIGMLTAQGREGRLCEVDTRMRPFGNKGPLATSLASFDKYYDESAWVFEKLALTRGRVVWAEGDFSDRITASVRRHLTSPMEKNKLSEGLHYIRGKIAETYNGKNIWDIKHAAGGLLDCDFLVQYLTLMHGQKIRYLLPAAPAQVMAEIAACGVVDSKHLNQLIQARTMLTTLLYYLRLCAGENADIRKAPTGLRRLLYESCDCETFEKLEEKLSKTEAKVSRLMRTLT